MADVRRAFAEVLASSGRDRLAAFRHILETALASGGADRTANLSAFVECYIRLWWWRGTGNGERGGWAPVKRLLNANAACGSQLPPPRLHLCRTRSG